MTDMRIASLRRDRGWTQQRLATESGVGVRTVQRLEAGEDASLETLHLVAVALGVPVGELFAAREAPTVQRRRPRLIALVAALAVVGSLGGVTVGLLRPSTAEATVRAAVTFEQRASGTPATSQYRSQVLRSDALVALTPLVLREADRRLAVPIGTRALAASVRTTSTASQIAVTARAGTGPAAIERADGVLDALIAEIHLLTPNRSDTIQVVTRVGRPAAQDPRALAVWTSGGIGLGGGAAIGLVVVLLRTRSRRPEAAAHPAVAVA